ncbi:MAG: SMC-Scp complex subunit ScpB [Armatimonadetes bacterium]|nr:SMC-Scp complex subunit ScpB [Armatimonadota bacterium]
MNLADELEAVLFAADAPASLEILAAALNYSEGQIAQGLEVLEARLEAKGGLQLVQIGGGYQLSTKPEYADSVARFLKPRPQRLSRSQLEVLAIVAYKQPVTLAEVDTIRGVQSDYGLRLLVERQLIEEVGRKMTPGRPLLYGTTDRFLHQFKLNSLEQLPPLTEDGKADLGKFNVL